MPMRVTKAKCTALPVGAPPEADRFSCSAPLDTLERVAAAPNLWARSTHGATAKIGRRTGWAGERAIFL